eukprot:358752_1
MNKFIQRYNKTIIKSGMVLLGGIATADFISYNFYERERKKLTRITESIQNQFGGKGQHELLRSNCSLLITPSFDNIHSFEQFKNMDDEYATEKNFRDLLTSYVEWKCSKMSFKNIPENQLTLITNYWDVMRTDHFIIKDKYFRYKLIPNDYKTNIDIENKNIIYDDLTVNDINNIIKLNENIDKYYMEQVIKSERISIGAFDSEKDKKLIGYSYVHIDDLSASDVVIEKEYSANNDIALKLRQLTVNKHFDQNYDHLNVNVDVDDVESIQVVENMGFKRLPQTYYWIESIDKVM